jgi:hypothetical protein
VAVVAIAVAYASTAASSTTLTSARFARCWPCYGPSGKE